MWMEAAVIVGTCVLFAGILFVTDLTSSCCGPSSHAEMMRGFFGRLSHLLLWALTTLPIFWACEHVRPRHLGWTKTILGHVLLALAIAVAVRWGQKNVYLAIATIWPPDNRPSPVGPVEVLTNLQFLSQLIPYVIILAIGLGRREYLTSRKRRKRANQLQREAEQLRAQLTSARLEALRMQLNPHFLFNTLHTISTMAGRNPEGIQKATARLSDMLRYALSTSDQQEVPLNEELDVLDSYLEIQKLRLDDRLSVSIDVDPEVRHALVPTLLLQPLVENAVKHGFEGRDETGHLTVRAARDADDLILHVVDDGRGVSDDVLEDLDTNGTADDGLGLGGLSERLQGLYGEAASLTLDASDGGGLSVRIRLPYHEHPSDGNLRTSGVVAD